MFEVDSVIQNFSLFVEELGLLSEGDAIDYFTENLLD